MPWSEVSLMSSRKEFVSLARQEGSHFRGLCRRFGISPKTGYKWANRHAAEGEAGLKDRPRQPKSSPRRTPPPVEKRLLSARDAHPAWGARKLLRWLSDQGQTGLPGPSTVTAILRRHGRLDPTESAKHTAWTRFEHSAPNDLWQMDFKGHVAMRLGRCHPLTVLDDHSRYAVCLRACLDEQTATVQEALTETFRRYGLPWRMTMDNGPPWGGDADSPYTTLTVWLLRLGIRVGHSRPYHPQTQGKDERFHRTLKAELLGRTTFADQTEAQRRLDAWRDLHNLERPHQALGMMPPARRYQPSTRMFPEALPPIEYAPDDLVRKVQGKGELSYRGREWKVGKAFQGLPVALRRTAVDGVIKVFFCHQPIASINLLAPPYTI
ncbi:MAG: IS481 family transposase [Candidatus Competibacteraceae bacterium]|nr:IS481 family transposase [Candidatus Competibacteraceae bacterium]